MTVICFLSIARRVGGVIFGSSSYPTGTICHRLLSPSLAGFLLLFFFVEEILTHVSILLLTF